MLRGAGDLVSVVVDSRREPLIARPSVSTRPLDLSVFTFSAMPYLRNVVIT